MKPTSSISIKPYWILNASDYHVFNIAQQHYKAAGLDVKFEEVGCNGQYNAVFWVGKKPIKYIKSLKLFNQISAKI